jgi:hypothetical protein
MIVFILDLVGFTFFPDHTPGWLRFLSGLTLVGALISGVTCITTAVFSRVSSGATIDNTHENDAA